MTCEQCEGQVFERLLKNSPFTLRRAQGERSNHGIIDNFSVHAELVEACSYFFNSLLHCNISDSQMLDLSKLSIDAWQPIDPG